MRISDWSSDVCSSDLYQAEHAGADGSGDQVAAPMPGRIVLVRVAGGDSVAQGQELLVMEPMKMELSLKAPRDGVVAGAHGGRRIRRRRRQPGHAGDLSMALPSSVRIVEVGPRDGLQNEKAILPTTAKNDFIDRPAATCHRTAQDTS